MSIPTQKFPLWLIEVAKIMSLYLNLPLLVHLAEKFGVLLPEKGSARTQVFNWLFWLHGSAPYLGGGFGHFYAYAPEKFEYAINRFTMETKRQLDVLDKQLANNEFLAGDEYSIADIATWPWYGNTVLITSQKLIVCQLLI